MNIDGILINNSHYEIKTNLESDKKTYILIILISVVELGVANTLNTWGNSDDICTY
jgi:hypothetical protein